MRNLLAFKRLFIIGISLLASTGCVKEIARPVPEVISKPGPTVEQIQYEPSWGPKKRIAVMRIDNKSSLASGGQFDIGTGMANQLVSALFQSGGFIILERQELQDILGEQKFGSSGHVKEGTEAKTGEIEGAEFLVYGAITDYDPGESGARVGVEVGGLTGKAVQGGAIKAGAGYKQAYVSIDLKIIDANTGRIVNATSVEGHPREIKGGLGIESEKIFFGTEAYYKTPIGQAVRDCLNRAVDFIVKTAFLQKNVKTTLIKKDLNDPSAPLVMQVWSDRNEYKQGERIKIYLKGNKSFYARVVYRDVEGNMLQLLPNPYRAGNHFRGGEVYEIPSVNDKFELEVTPPFGEENVILYASTSELGDIDLKPRGGVYVITTKEEEIRAKTRGVKVKDKAEGKNAATSEFCEEKAVIRTNR